MHHVRMACRFHPLSGSASSLLPAVSTLEDIYVIVNRYDGTWLGDVGNALWLELLHPFAGLKNLYLQEGFVHLIAPALQELVWRRTAEVLPTVENIFLERFRPSGPLHEGIETFATARLLARLVFHYEKTKSEAAPFYSGLYSNTCCGK